MIRRDFDQNEQQAVWIGHPKLDEAPGLLHRTFDDRNPGGAQLLLGPADIAHLKPKLGRRRRRLRFPIGELQIAAAQEEDHAARVTLAKLPHRMEAEDVPIEAQAAIEIPRVEHETAGKYLHRARSGSLHCPMRTAGYIRLISIA